MLDSDEYGKAAQRRPNRRSISARLSLHMSVGHGCTGQNGVCLPFRVIGHSFLQMSGACRL